jgi:hypothetical protein
VIAFTAQALGAIAAYFLMDTDERGKWRAMRDAVSAAIRTPRPNIAMHVVTSENNARESESQGKYCVPD